MYSLYIDSKKTKEIKVFSKKELEEISYPLIEVKTNGILKQALMLPISNRNNITNYISGSGQSITIQGQLITFMVREANYKVQNKIFPLQ